jgi:hypothetical protein
MFTQAGAGVLKGGCLRISSLFVATDIRSHQSKFCKAKPFYFVGRRVYHAAND